jgi:hypothetical protein
MQVNYEDRGAGLAFCSSAVIQANNGIRLLHYYAK